MKPVRGVPSQLEEVWPFDYPPGRVVSLVPSTTESLFELGWGHTVVGISDYCIHPAGRLEHLPRIGGPKNARPEEILDLRPDLVLANQEENTPALVAHLEQAGIKVWVSFPKNVSQALDVLYSLAKVYQDQAGVERVNALRSETGRWESAVEERQSLSYFCPIWQGEEAGELWWMAFNQDTYPHDLLRLFGLTNSFSARKRRYPLSADLGRGPETGLEDDSLDRRYPRLSTQEVREAAPDLILLPDEPYLFKEEHRQQITELLAEVRAVQTGRVYLLDGSLLTWHGIRLEKALDELPGILGIDRR